MQKSGSARKRSGSASASSRSVKAELVALKKERILEAATQLFLRNGYHGCTMDQIAAAIDVAALKHATGERTRAGHLTGQA